MGRHYLVRSKSVPKHQNSAEQILSSGTCLNIFSAEILFFFYCNKKLQNHNFVLISFPVSLRKMYLSYAVVMLMGAI